MLKEIKGQELNPGQEIYLFERGVGTVRRLCGYDDAMTEEIYEVKTDSEIHRVPSSLCFAIDANGGKRRTWKWNSLEVEITYDPIKLIFHGKPTWVHYSGAKGDEELFEEGDILHKDWEGMGIDFAMIISKWLRRLNGEKIPLSSYYSDPYNRMLDNL